MNPNLSSYPKVMQLGHPQILDIFEEPVQIEEKVDGSQFSFGQVNGDLFCRSRGKHISIDNPDKMFAPAVDYAGYLHMRDALADGFIYRGEYLQKPKHNTIAYSRIPKNNIVIFDIEDGLKPVTSYKLKCELAELLDLETAPLLYTGKVDSIEQIKELLNRESFLGGANIEGFVVKNYTRFTNDGKYYVGKYVSEAFKEKHVKEWKEKNPTLGDVIQILCQELRSEGRWNKAVQHARENGTLLGEPKDIGMLIRMVQEDIKEEETEYIKQKLYNYAIRRILSVSVAGLPEWYKEKMLNMTL